MLRIGQRCKLVGKPWNPSHGGNCTIISIYNDRPILEEDKHKGTPYVVEFDGSLARVRYYCKSELMPINTSYLPEGI